MKTYGNSYLKITSLALPLKMDTGVIDSSSISDLVFDNINSSRESDTTSGKP